MNSLSGGGMERAMLNLANYFVGQGASVDLLVASSKGPLLQEVSHSINLIDLNADKSKRKSIRMWLLKAALKLEFWFLLLFFARRLPKAVRVIPMLIDYMEESSPDIILSTPTTANLAAIWAKTYCGNDVKVVMREASTLSNEIDNKRTIFFRLIKKFVEKWYNHADTVICVSDGVNNDLSKNFSINKYRLITIYNILDVEKIKVKSKSEEHASLIENFGNYILAIGRLEKQKDFETLIRAFYIIAHEVSNNLVILGEGTERSKLVKLIDKLSLADRVYLPGFFINPYPFIVKCDVLALSSRWEGCPNVLREALVLQKKVISTDCPSGAKEILENGRLGELVEVGDASQFSERLYAVIRQNRNVENSIADEMNIKAKKSYKRIFML